MATTADKITQRVQDLLDKRGMTRQELAQRMGMSQSGLSNIMAGNRTWHIDRVTTAAQVLGVDPIVLLGGEEPQKTINRVCVELSPALIRVLQREASSQLRTLENYVEFVLVQHSRTIPDE